MLTGTFGEGLFTVLEGMNARIRSKISKLGEPALRQAVVTVYTALSAAIAAFPEKDYRKSEALIH